MSTTNILDLNNRIDELEKNSGGGGSADSAKRSDIATEFSTETSYTAGNFVYHEGKLYQFNADHSAGAWDPTDVVEENVTDQIVSNASAIAGLTASDVAYDNTTSGLSATNVQGAVDELAASYPADKVMMSDDVTSVEDAIDDLKHETIISITPDGVKTFGQYFPDLYTAISNYEGIRKESLTLQIGVRIFKLSYMYPGEYQFSMFSVGSHVYSRGVDLTATTCGYKLATDTTITDLINDVPTASEIITVYQ